MNLSSHLQRAKNLFRKAQWSQVEALCQEILAADNQQAEAINMLAQSCVAQHRLPQALRFLQQGVQVNPDHAVLNANLGQLLLRMDQPNEATQWLVKAINLDPKNTLYKNQFSQSCRYISCDTFSGEMKQALVKTLGDVCVTHRYLVGPWVSLVDLDPLLSALTRLRALTDYEQFKQSFDPITFEEALQDRLLLLGLSRLIIADAGFEMLWIYLRRYFLEHSACHQGKYLPLITAMGQHCFLTEYVHSQSNLEAEAIQSLIKRAQSLEPSSVETAIQLSLISCYQPLFELDNVVDLLSSVKKIKHHSFQNLVKTQIQEPLEEREIRKKIRLLKPLSNAVSTAVRDQYEENPYPRWENINFLPANSKAKKITKGKKILIAGCGTGEEAADTARAYPGADITAVDLSLASLSYAIRKCTSLGFNNIDFIQADILDLDALNKQFDYVISSGVLHHMEDPVAGLQSITRQLKPNGVMKIALYSTIARKNLKIAQDWIIDNKQPATLAGIRQFRDMLKTLAGSPMQDLLQLPDFYSTSMARDLVFHVQETTYTLKKLVTIFEREKLNPLKLILPNQAAVKPAYLARFPHDPDATNLMNWHKFELDHPLTFAAMYHITLCRTEEKSSFEFAWLRAALEPELQV
jgi:2-polyprenyl-3-methyl-5-hydroxy-6-metoxy-1,4-benzoquinol methylase